VVFPGNPWYAAEPDGPHLRLTFAAAPPDLLDEGVRRLADALDNLTRAEHRGT
jgi:DNA-binding transcriptional MocR family regulator